MNDPQPPANPRVHIHKENSLVYVSSDKHTLQVYWHWGKQLWCCC
jgi:hypothetical protein